MSDPPAPPTQSVPPPPVQRIDWLALAPWLILLRCPQIAVSWRLWLPGAILSVAGLAAPLRAPESTLTGIASASLKGIAWPCSCSGSFSGLVGQPGGLSFTAGHTLLILALITALFVLVISRVSARRLTEQRDTKRPRSALSFAARRLLRAPIATALILIPGLIAIALAWGIGWFESSLLWPLVLLLGVPAAIILIVAAVSAPLAVAAVAVDDADTFDALSRAVAYATQRPARLAGYLCLATGVGFTSGLLLESVIAVHHSLTQAVAEIPGNGASWWITDGVFYRALRGYYVAYWIAAVTAIYLLLRRDVDGQPINEMAPQPSADA